MARLWLAVALCVVIFVVLADDVDARCGGRRAGTRGTRGVRINKGGNKNGRIGSRKGIQKGGYKAKGGRRGGRKVIQKGGYKAKGGRRGGRNVIQKGGIKAKGGRRRGRKLIPGGGYKAKGGRRGGRKVIQKGGYKAKGGRKGGRKVIQKGGYKAKGRRRGGCKRRNTGIGHGRLSRKGGRRTKVNHGLKGRKRYGRKQNRRRWLGRRKGRRGRRTKVNHGLKWRKRYGRRQNRRGWLGRRKGRRGRRTKGKRTCGRRHGRGWLGLGGHGRRHSGRGRINLGRKIRFGKRHRKHHHHGRRINKATSSCKGNPCLNHGSCIPNGKRYRCKCERGFSGLNCETGGLRSLDVCARVPCQNGGTCIPSNGFFKCSCSDNYRGELCEKEINTNGPCESNPCANGGECHTDGDDFLCSCTEKYEGFTCTIETIRSSPCDENPCRNFGQCVPIGRQLYRCDCTKGYSGKQCTIAPRKDPCEDNPCKNSGVCTSKGDGDFNCACTGNFEGVLCDVGKNKVGTCPSVPLTIGGICVEKCRSDSDCTASDKCCSNGCGHVCKIPCPLAQCRKYCPTGFLVENGCEVCKCKDIDIQPPRVTPPEPKVADVLNKETLASAKPFDLSVSFKIRLSIIWDTDLRISFKVADSTKPFYVVYIGWDTARIELCEGTDTCKVVDDGYTKDVLKKSTIEFNDFYIRFSQDGTFEIGFGDPDVELMSYHADNPPTGDIKMFISTGGKFPANWDVSPPVIEETSVLVTSTSGDGKDVDLRLKPVDTRANSKLRFCVIGGSDIRIGLKSVLDLNVYCVVHIGKETSYIEICDETCERVEEEDTPGTFSTKVFINYYILFGSDGSIRVALEDTDTFFLAYENGNPSQGLFNIFISSGENCIASWKIHESVTIQEDTITIESHVIEQEQDTWAYISPAIRSSELGLQVGVAADKPVYIALMNKQGDEANAYQFVFRAEDNTEIKLMQGGAELKSAPYNLTASSLDEYANFWITWADRKLCIGTVVEQVNNDPLLCYDESESDFTFSEAGVKADFMDYIGFYSFEYSLASGKFFTYDSSFAYPLRFKRARFDSSTIEFGVMTDSDAHLAVASCSQSDTLSAPMYELVLGSDGNDGCFIRRCKGCKEVVKGDCQAVLDDTEHREFTFEWGGGKLRLYQGRGSSKISKPLLSWDDTSPLTHIHYLATATGFKSNGFSRWILYRNEQSKKDENHGLLT